ncbi:DHA2 family efflux MFS transporter permease subunit [Liquorilactobacillus satsumensis]|uniref:DHA2 family efflux MFS transporter permease subunit n=1 Tax=Liquorilactobacillus satsumensis TaxID=259059 RepID=UPI001E2EA67B|nr:DHA2 family efflux MFS transporter permease subunit [Liquorilactobacillus satsumensis]MCC7666281.1 MFS transporter [Liquorilactobacillus satsumensis]MCP9358042.1 DHA2 family efflux MFS transporter permease subunit [Liquorilactobacillus satsumensis]MCP9372055.1 DHA2 family efflux MFS transporter permease subunit [Liquorilactobacillus satsumensis]
MKKTKTKIPTAVMTTAWILVFGALAPLLDSTMINIALHSLVKDLNSSVETVQWTITCYVLATGIAVPFSSWLLNKFDGKLVFLTGEILFAGGSFLAAISPTISSLIAARLVQGFAGGLIMPLLTTLLVQTTDSALMGQMMATVGLPIILGPLVGPIIGGIIIKYLSWHWIFWVNLPIAVLSILLIIWKMPSFPAQNKNAKMALLGIILLASATTTMIYGIVKAAHSGDFTNQTTLLFVGIGLVLMVCYLTWAAYLKEKAVLPLKLFTHHSFSGSVSGLFIAGTVLNGAMLLLPLFFQDVRSMTVMAAGLALIPQGVGMLISRPLTGKLTDYIGAKYVVLASLFITFCGTIPFNWIDGQTSAWIIALVLFIRGIGAGGILMPLMADSYTGVAQAQVPAASIGARTIQNIGSAFGSALIATVVTAHANNNVAAFKEKLAAGKFQVAPDQLQTFVQHQLMLIKVQSFQFGFMVIAVAALLIILPTLLLTNKMPKDK